MACLLGPGLVAGAFPVITGFTPTSGPPGTSVTITGSDLAEAAEVSFGMAPAIFNVSSESRVVATVPLDATTGPITVVSPSGLAVTFAHFQVSPRVTEFSPGSAPVGGTVVIEGFNFQGATRVRFSGTSSNASFSVTSPTQIRAMVPPGTVSGPIEVTTPIGSAWSEDDFVVIGTEPFIESFAPAAGGPGTPVTIQGLNFTGATGVMFHDRSAAFSVTSPTQVRTTVPNGAGTGLIRISNRTGTNVSASPFVVSTAPVIEEFTPLAGPPGTPVVLNGQNFLGATAVRFGGVSAAAFSVTAASQLHATVPAGASNGVISVTTPGGTGQSPFAFLATTAPLIVDFNPPFGLVGSTVAINGINFAQITGVKINGVNASFSVTAPTQVNAIVPPNATSGPITVVGRQGTNETRQPFLVRTGRPIVVETVPPAGAPRTPVRIDGLDFSRATAVRFNGVAAAYEVVADTQISALVPDNAITGPVSVTTPAGTGVSSNRFIVSPRIGSFSPTNGVAGTRVTIRGTNFTDLLAVRFREAFATFETLSTNEISAIVPTDAVTGSINLINPAGIVATTNFFFVLPQVDDFTPAGGPPGTQVTVHGSGFNDVIAIQFGGVNASSWRVVSSTEIVAAVPAGAATGPISVRTSSGQGSSRQAFVVGIAADVAVLQTQSTNRIVQNQALAYTLTVTNRGPATASGVVLSNTWPASAVLVSVAASQGTVHQDPAGLRVVLGTLAAAAQATLQVTVLTPVIGSLTNTASVRSQEADPDLSNNSSTVVTQVEASPALLSAAEVAGNVRISWPAAAGDFLLQMTEDWATPVSWQTVPAAPVTVGDQKVVTVPLAGGRRFYRLQRP